MRTARVQRRATGSTTGRAPTSTRRAGRYYGDFVENNRRRRSTTPSPPPAFSTCPILRFYGASMTLLPPQMDECIKLYLALKAKLGKYDLESHDLNGQYLFSTDDGSRPYPTSSWTKVVKVRRYSRTASTRACATHCATHTAPRRPLFFKPGCVSSAFTRLEGARSEDSPQYIYYVDA